MGLGTHSPNSAEWNHTMILHAHNPTIHILYTYMCMAVCCVLSVYERTYTYMHTYDNVHVLV